MVELRQKIYDKYDGKCAYCGEDIDIESFQIDHIHPKHLSHLEDADNNRHENLNPSCRKCNNFKNGSRLEVFRSELSLQVERLLRNSTWAARQFDRALRFNQVKITKSPIVFHFERQGVQMVENEAGKQRTLWESMAWGSFDLQTGYWHYNPDIKLTYNEQFEHNVKYGHMCKHGKVTSRCWDCVAIEEYKEDEDGQ